MRVSLAIAIVLAGFVPAIATAGTQPDPNVLGAAVGGDAATSAVLDEEHKLLLVQLVEPTPDWAAMRDRVKAAQRTLDADGSLPGWGVAFMWTSNAMAISQNVGGHVQTDVGDGYTMLQDKAEYTLAASPIAVQPTNGWDWGSGYRAGQKVTCKGNAQNLGDAPAEITVRCTIYGVVTAGSLATWRADSGTQEKKSVVLATVDHSLGTLKPGKKAKYSFKLALEDVDRDPALQDFCMLQCSVESMSFDQVYLVDGAETGYFDAARNVEGKAWLGLLADLRDEGLTLRVTGMWNPHETYQTFAVAEPFASLDGKQRAKASKRIWKKLKAHVKKYAKAKWFIAYLTDESGVSIGRLDEGRFIGS
jgi:hypothetical protein